MYGNIINEDGSIRVENNKVIVKNPVGNGNKPIIIPPENGDLIINKKIVKNPTVVNENSEIEFKEYIVIGNRDIDITWSRDKTEAYISIKYNNGKRFILKDSKESNILALDLLEVEYESVKKLTKKELLMELKNRKISYGIIEETLDDIINGKEVKKLLIAKGKKPKPPIEDKIKIFFNDSKEYKNDEKIDYRSFNTIRSVKANDKLAEIIKGENGLDGINIFNEVIPRKEKKNRVFSLGNGTKKKENIIISTINGKPNFSKNKIWVEPLYCLNKDVDISTGNINFPANVEIKGKVTEGMKVTSGGSLLIHGGVFNAKIEAKENTKVLGNIINSNIKVGGTNLIKKERINTLKELKELLNVLFVNLDYLEKYDLVKNIPISSLIETLIEKKFKSIYKIMIKTISNALKDGCNDSEVTNLLKSRLIGTSIKSIKSIYEIRGIIYSIDKEIKELEEVVIIESTLNMEDVQESDISVVGNINVHGKGVFTSKLYATKGIDFTSKKVICRGGYLKAEELIRASIIGSTSGVITSLEVSNNGHIYVDIAYQNTKLIIGNKIYILEKNSKNIHAYLDKSGSMVVDKLLL